MTENIYFQLTREFNAGERRVLLASGQAVVAYRLAIMSKDGDWIIRETDSACRFVRGILSERGAHYRPGVPLDPRWLAGGWSSHLEFADPERRRIRCDFFSRPPRIPLASLERLFSDARKMKEVTVIDVPSLIRMKQTQRAKDYPVIGELARLLPPQEELEFTTDPDRILDLAESHGEQSSRPSVRAAREGRGRLTVVQTLAVEIDTLQQEDRQRLKTFERAGRRYMLAVGKLHRDDLRLPGGHERLCDLAQDLLPPVQAQDAWN